MYYLKKTNIMDINLLLLLTVNIGLAAKISSFTLTYCNCYNLIPNDVYKIIKHFFLTQGEVFGKTKKGQSLHIGKLYILTYKL